MSPVVNRMELSPHLLSWYSYPLLFEELRGAPLDPSQLLVDFSRLPLPPSVSVIDAAGLADKFFEKYGTGNNLAIIDRPFERFHAYELLLGTLAGENRSKYDAIHKGTPYYFLGWTAFQTENYEKGIYYLDQAISEDIRKSNTTDIAVIRPNPAVNSLLLDPQGQSGAIMAIELRAEMDKVFAEFSRRTGLTLTAQAFTDSFIIGSGRFFDSTFRTILTTLYSFVLEHHTLVTSLNLRSDNGGSLEPFFLHLLKGGLLLESILKLQCAQGVRPQLGPVIRHLEQRLGINRQVVLLGQISLQDLTGRLDTLVQNNETYENICFAATYGVRNTTGHNLIWTDIFQNGDVEYRRLFSHVIDAILWSIYKLWIE